MRGRRPSTVRVVLTHMGLVLFTGLTLYPVLWVLKMALTPSQAFTLGVNPWPTDPSFANFEAVMGLGTEGSLFFRQAFNSIAIASCTQQRTPRRHGLSQHAIVGVAALEAGTL